MQAAARPKKHTTHDFAVQSIEEHVAAFYHSTKMQLFLVSANAADPSQRALVTLAQQLEAWLKQQRGGKENKRMLSASINLPMGMSPDKPMLKQVGALYVGCVPTRTCIIPTAAHDTHEKHTPQYTAQCQACQ